MNPKTGQRTKADLDTLDVDLSDVQQMTTQLREGIVKKSQKSSCLLKWNVMKRMWLLAIKAIRDCLTP